MGGAENYVYLLTQYDLLRVSFYQHLYLCDLRRAGADRRLSSGRVIEP